MSEGDTENAFLYCGEQYNALTGLYYLRARYMNPSTGTFISEDSYAGRMHEPVTLHKYLYAHANPVKYMDPSGYYATYADVLGAVALMATLVGIVEIGTGHLRTMLVSMMEDLESIKDSLGMWIRYYIHQAATKNPEETAESSRDAEEEAVKQENDDSRNVIPDNDSVTGHIFRDKEGHVADTPENREMLEETANNPDNHKGKDKYGNDWYSQTLDNGQEVWVEVRNGRIIDGGLNQTPKPWNPQTGLKKP